MNEEKKEKLIHLAIIAAVTFITAFLAFYIALVITLNRVTNPLYNARQIDRMLQHQEREFRKFEEQLENHPFLPKYAPMPVNLVKEDNEYKVIVNLKPLEGNEKGIDVKIKDNIVSVKGELDKNTKHGQEMVSFSQSYYLDEKILADKIEKIKKNDKLIITIPFAD